VLTEGRVDSKGAKHKKMPKQACFWCSALETTPDRWRGHKHQEYAQVGMLLVFSALLHQRTFRQTRQEGFAPCRVDEVN